ncbi:PLP-dependent aminotransferase family protein [Agromyces seonyuensis]|uniref:Aminotransferase class I/II-fold pyridoxal phosphate-dependent enzyme n=1 Tax=Agromyces seonyuensis TaxID=2662446 RepID=A0A6I4P527_9MICO|nr:PLP-dependent aminotransferase family protein [Agromyces seonyuensis]MWB98597.1 aminotransferase class I/II-fold pyridoxal phosphate-dependent enzyme [Agromyces seonyuensis]
MSTPVLSARSLATLLGDWRSAAPANEALADRVRLLVLDGRIPAGTRLPADRELAERLSVSRTTIAAAYARLRDRELVHSLRGSGSVVRPHGGTGIAPAATGAGVVDFSKAAPPALPWLPEIAREAVDELPAHLEGPGFDGIGLPRLRTALADRYTARGLPTNGDQIMVTLGAQHAIALLSRTLLARGDRALIEAPTYPHAYEALRLAGARLATVPTAAEDDDGFGRLDEGLALEQAVQQSNPALAYVMPDFQNPTGRTLDEEARARLTAAAARQGTVLIADETTAELNIDRPGGVPAPLAASGPAVLVGSVGKTVWGGVRVGWIRADVPLIRRLAQARPPGDLGTPILEQLMVARLLERYDEVLELRRAQLRASRDRLEAALAAAFPEWRVPHVHGGIATWIDLGAAVSSQLVLAARTRGVVVAAGPRFGIDGAFERRLRLPISATPDEIDAGVLALRDAWEALPGLPALEPELLGSVV